MREREREMRPVGDGLQARRRPLCQTQGLNPQRHRTVTGRGKQMRCQACPPTLYFLRWVCARKSIEKTHTVSVYCKQNAPVWCNVTLSLALRVSFGGQRGRFGSGVVWRQPWSRSGLWTRPAVWAWCTSQLPQPHTHSHTEQKRVQLGPWFSAVGGRSQKTGILKE